MVRNMKSRKKESTKDRKTCENECLFWKESQLDDEAKCYFGLMKNETNCKKYRKSSSHNEIVNAVEYYHNKKWRRISIAFSIAAIIISIFSGIIMPIIKYLQDDKKLEDMELRIIKIEDRMKLKP
jgi:hypothetical protein